MTRSEVKQVFATDDEGRFVNLVIPPQGEFPEIDLTGKKRLELSLDEIIRLKKYAGKLYSTAEKEPE